MAQRPETENDAKEQVWSQLEKGHASMLWIEGSEQHPQPMTHFVDRDTGAIWFITSSETDLAKAIGPAGVEAGMTFVAPSQDFHASLEGRLDIVDDAAKLDEFWNVAAAAWFEHGRDDPTVRLLRFKPTEAATWASDRNSVLVGLKVLRAGLTEGEADPNVGVHQLVAFDKAA